MKKLIVQKYGGSSVANLAGITNVANRIKKQYKAGNKIIVVISAQAGETKELINLAQQITPEPDKRELDVLLATGEQKSAALVALMLNQKDLLAKSLLTYQAGIIINRVFGNARILEIDKAKIKDVLNQRTIPIVAGFQGRAINGNLTTLGPGGSDTTAIALAASFKAHLCEIYTDVDGVYTTDPNICEQAKKINSITYSEMIEMSSLGAKVLEIKSVEIAKQYNIPIYIRSSFNNKEGTMISKKGIHKIKEQPVTAVIPGPDYVRITITDVPDKPGIAGKIFTAIDKINVDMISQSNHNGKKTDLSFTVSKKHFKEALNIIKETAIEIKAGKVTGDENVAKVSIIGAGMINKPGIAAQMFSTLGRQNINIIMISTAEAKISCLIEKQYIELAVRSLHYAFALDK